MSISLREGHVDALVEAQLVGEDVAPSRNEPRAFGSASCLEVGCVAVDGLARLGRRVGEIAEHERIVEIRERPRQVALDEGDQPRSVSRSPS